MANLTAAINLQYKEAAKIRLNVAVAATLKFLWGGAVVIPQGSGYANKPSGVITERFIGFCADSIVDNTSGADGDLRMNVVQPEFFVPNAFSAPPGAADVGKRYYFQDDNTVGLGLTANFAGVLRYADKGSVYYIDARPAYMANESSIFPKTTPTSPVEGSAFIDGANKLNVYIGGAWLKSAALA